MIANNKKAVLIISLLILAIILIGSVVFCRYLINLGAREDFPPVLMPNGEVINTRDPISVFRVVIDEKKGNFNNYKDGFFKLLDAEVNQKHDNYSATIKQSVGVANIGDDNIGLFTEIDIDVQDNVAHGFFKSYISHYDKNIVFEEEYEFYRTYDGQNATTYLNVNGQWLSVTNKPMFDHVAIDIESIIKTLKQQDFDYFPCVYENSSIEKYYSALSIANSDIKTTKVGQAFYDIHSSDKTVESISISAETGKINMYAFMHRKLSSTLLTQANEEIHDSFLNFLLDTWNEDLHVGGFGIIFDQWGGVTVDIPPDIATQSIAVDSFSDVTLNLQQAILCEIENCKTTN